MGFYLLHESMLDSVIKARDKHLQVNIFCDFYYDYSKYFCIILSL